MEDDSNSSLPPDSSSPAESPGSPLGDLARMAWAVLASMPLVGALAWLVAAVFRRRWCYLGRALLALVAPTLGLIMTVVVAEFLIGRALLHGEKELSVSDDLDLEILLLALVWGAQWVSAGMAAWRLWPGVAEGRRSAAELRRPYWVVWVLWFSLGWIGIHRFYCGRWISGLVYVFTLGLGGVGWAFDMFYFDVLAEGASRVPVGPITPSRLAPWAAELRYRRLEFLLRLAYFCLAPFVFVHFCVYFGHFELLAVMVVVVIACGFLGDLEQVIARMHYLERIPMTRPAVFFFRELYEYYMRNRPQPFVFYIFQILLSPFLVWFSPQLRRELWLYGKFLLTIFAVLAVQQLQAIGTTYRYMPASRIAFWIGVHLLFTAIMTWQFLVPIITTSFTMKLSGQQRGLKVLSFLVLALTLPIGGMSLYFVNHSPSPSVLSWNMLHSRLEHAGFREDLSAASELFLKHYQPYSPPPVAPDTEALHTELTRRYQLHVGNLAPETETRAFQVFTYSEHSSPSELWLAVVLSWRHERATGEQTLFLLTPDGRFIANWDAMSPAVRSRFDRIASVAPLDAAEEHRIAERSAEIDSRLYRESSRWLTRIAESEAERLAPWLAADATAASGPSKPSPETPTSASSASGPASTEVEEVRFRGRLTRQYRDLIKRLGLSDADGFRVFEIASSDEVWLGIRDQRHALLTVSSMGDSLSRWDQELFDPASEAMQQFQRLENHVVPPPRGVIVHDAALAKDLHRQYTREFLDFAANARWRELDGGWGLHLGLTREYREMLVGLMPTEQRSQMNIFVWREGEEQANASDGGKTLVCFGVRYGPQPLFVRDAMGTFHMRSRNLSPDAAQTFAALAALPTTAGSETSGLQTARPPAPGSTR